MSKYRINEFGEAKIIFLGLDNAGKTTIYNTLIGQPDKELKTTGGFNTQKMKYNDDISMDLWDIGGSSKIRP